jgi:hypothetical protein
MFQDEDYWPVRCPNCGNVTYRNIGWLKANSSLQCSGCEAVLSWYYERLIRDLDDAQRAVESFSRGLRAENKRQ